MCAFNFTFTGIVTDVLEIEQDVNNKDGHVGQVAFDKEQVLVYDVQSFQSVFFAKRYFGNG